MPAADDPSLFLDPTLGSMLGSARGQLGGTARLAPGDLAGIAFGPPAAADELGTLGPYRVVRPLGRGAMGAVLLAVDTRLDRRVALKVMLPELAAEAEARERFLREAKAAARIGHDHVVTVYEADERDGVPYIAMQLLEGLSLNAYLVSRGVPSLRRSVRIAREAALGLGAAHRLGTVHRDIKPANLWLEAPGGRVKLLDFGLARPGGIDTELTRSGAVLGTPAFMSPEQALGERVDHRTDLFSLGAVLYLLCTRQLPFTGASVGAVLRALGTRDPAPVQSLNIHVPGPLAELVCQLLAKDPDARPQTAAEVADRLNAILQQPSWLASDGTAEGPVELPAGPGSRAGGADPWTTRAPSTASHRGGHVLARPDGPKLLHTMPVVVFSPSSQPEQPLPDEPRGRGAEEATNAPRPTHTVISSGVVWEDPEEPGEEERDRRRQERTARDRPPRRRPRAKPKGGSSLLLGVGIAVLVVSVAVVVLVVARGKPRAPEPAERNPGPVSRPDEPLAGLFAPKAPPAEAAPRDAGAIDLLALVDPKIDAVRGQWRRSGGAVIGLNPSFPGVLQLPYEPGDEYDVEVVVRRLSGDEYFGVQLVAGGRRVNASLDTWPSRGYLSGFGDIGGRSLLNNGTAVGGRRLVQPEVGYAVNFAVRNGQIDIAVNGGVIASYRGGFSRLSIHPDFSVPNDRALAVQIGYNTPFQIDRLVVTPVSGRGRLLR